MSGGTQQAHKRVAEDGVPQVSDVRRLVGIDAGVLDQRMQWLRRRGNLGADGIARDQRGAIQTRVDVSGAGHLKRRESGNGTERRDNLLGDLARGLAQLAGQLEGERRGVFAESQLRRLLEHDGLDFDLIKAAEHSAKALLQLLLLFEIHARTTNRGKERLPFLL